MNETCPTIDVDDLPADQYALPVRDRRVRSGAFRVWDRAGEFVGGTCYDCWRVVPKDWMVLATKSPCSFKRRMRCLVCDAERSSRQRANRRAAA